MTPAPGQLATWLQHNTSIIEINDTNDPQTEQLKKTDALADIKEFFTPMPRVPGQEKARILCKLCEVATCFSFLSILSLSTVEG